MQFPRARVVLALGVLTLLVAATSSAQTWSPDSISLSVAGGGAQCSYVEVIMTSGLTHGHESTSVRSSGAGFVQGWDEKCGWGKGPCPADAGTGEWNPAIGYGGPLHLIYQLTSSPLAKFWVVWDDGNVGPPIYTTHEYPVSVTPAAAKTAGLWSTTPDLPADGKSTAALTVAASGPTCGALRNAPVVLTTSHGRLRAGAQEGASITVTTGTNGRAAAILVAADTAGTAHVTADIGGASAETTVRMLGYSLTLTATPETLAADGKAAGLVTATLTDGVGGVATGQSVTLSTDRGTLRDTAGQTGTSITGTTNSQGEYFASLQSTDTPGTAHVKASFTNGSKTSEATKDVEFKGYEITLDPGQAHYQRVASLGSGGTSPQDDVSRDVREATAFGLTKFVVTAKLTMGSATDAATIGNKTIKLRSPEAAGGSGDVRFMEVSGGPLTEIVTDSKGQATFELEIEGPWKRPTSLAGLTAIAELATDASVRAEFAVTVIDNLQQVVERYQSRIEPGPLHTSFDAWMNRLRDSDAQRIAPWFTGAKNDAFVSAAFDYIANPSSSELAANWKEAFVQATAPWYQQRVLTLLHRMQWAGRVDDNPVMEDERWLLNGLDWAPLFVQGDYHVAVVLYPTLHAGNTEAEWRHTRALVLDPWLEQTPKTYSWAVWENALGMSGFFGRTGASGTAVQTREFTPGSFGIGDYRPSNYYPANNHYYYDPAADVPAPFNETQAEIYSYSKLVQLHLDCPVFGDLSDSTGRHSGYAPEPAASPFVDQIPGARRLVLKKPDGTYHWVWLVPDTSFTLRADAYASGAVDVSVTKPDAGATWFYQTTLAQGQAATLAMEPGLTPPSLGTPAGSVAATVIPAGLPGPDPAIGLVGGGSRVIVRGVSGSGDVSVSIGGQQANGVTWLNATTIEATVPTGVAGAADVVVTPLQGSPTTFAGGFAYDFARQYLAEGATGSLFDTAIALLNPADADVWGQMRFLKADKTTVEWPIRVGAHGRATVNVRDVPGMDTAEFATTVETSLPAVVDRTMTWSRGETYGSHAERAVPSPALTWYLAEGATHSGFDLFYLLQNPNTTAAQVRVTYLRPSPSTPLEQVCELPPQSRVNLWVNLVELPAGSGQRPLASTDVSAKVEVLNGQSIIVERAMYLSTGGKQFSAGHESAGVTEPNTRWFLAEGASGPFFDLFVLVANPTADDAAIEARYMLADGTVYTKAYTVAANSRFNIWVNLEEIPGGSGTRPLATASLSTLVTSTNGVPVIVERSMWWPKVGGWYEAHNSPGSTLAGTRWGLAEGEVGGSNGIETYVLIANTSDFAGRARVTAVMENGTTEELLVDLLPNSRMTVPMGAPAPFGFGAAVKDRRFGTIVESVDTGAGVPRIVIERAMYNNAGGVTWAAGSNALGTRLR